MSPQQQMTRTIVAVDRVARHSHAPDALREAITAQARMVQLWAEEMRTRLDAWVATGARGKPPVEGFDRWRVRRGL